MLSLEIKAYNFFSCQSKEQQKITLHSKTPNRLKLKLRNLFLLSNKMTEIKI